MSAAAQIIYETKKWIDDVVVGCNFCPFAANVVKKQTIYYKVEESIDTAICLEALLTEVIRLDDETAIETTLLIFSNSFKIFDDYLSFVFLAEKLLKKKGYEGIYQIASFHPLYLFKCTLENDAANYTNRSIYPMLHLLREAAIDMALENYSSPENIPDRNINFAREKGLVYMKMLRDACL
jgi:uncharacterized protein